jgi:hypothetical protein
MRRQTLPLNQQAQPKRPFVLLQGHRQKACEGGSEAENAPSALMHVSRLCFAILQVNYALFFKMTFALCTLKRVSSLKGQQSLSIVAPGAEIQ